MQVVDWADVPEAVRHHFRRKYNKHEVDPKKTTCMLYLQVFKYISWIEFSLNN